MNFEDKINDLYENKIEELNNITIDKLNRFKRFECLDNCLRNIFGPACCFVHRYRYNEFFKEYDSRHNKNIQEVFPQMTDFFKLCEAEANKW